LRTQLSVADCFEGAEYIVSILGTLLGDLTRLDDRFGFLD
jgi:hypothetical protein